VLGAGKTAMDACIWLLQSGTPADAITWVMPRDSWVVNRLSTQNGREFFKEADRRPGRPDAGLRRGQLDR